MAAVRANGTTRIPPLSRAKGSATPGPRHWNCKIRVLIIDNTVRESRLCILLKDNRHRPKPGVIVDRNMVGLYVQNFTSGRTYVLFLDSNGNPGGMHTTSDTPAVATW